MKHYAKYLLIALLLLVGTADAGRDGSGTYSLPAGNPVSTGSVISSTWANNTLSDIATALTNSIAKDGQTTATANLPMGGFKHTNIADATARNHYASAGQVQDFSLQTLSSVSGTNTITANLIPPITSYATGMIVSFKPANANTGATTIAINGLSAKSIVKGAGTALAANDLVTTTEAIAIYDGTNVLLLNPQAALPPLNGSALTALNASSLSSGTVPDAQFPATLPAISGANLTSLNASNLSSGTVPDARFPATLPAVSGANLTSLNATNVSSGTLNAARLPTAAVQASTASMKLASAQVTTGSTTISPNYGFTSCTVTGTGTLTCNITAAGFTQTPVCVGNQPTGQGVAYAFGASSTSVQIQTVNTGFNLATALAVEVICVGP